MGRTQIADLLMWIEDNPRGLSPTPRTAGNQGMLRGKNTPVSYQYQMVSPENIHAQTRMYIPTITLKRGGMILKKQVGVHGKVWRARKGREK